MATNHVSMPHSPALMSVKELWKFIIIGTQVHLGGSAVPYPVEITPGTLTVDEEATEEGWSVQIEFKTRRNDRKAEQMLRILAKTPLVMLYVDEYGERRVAGQPDFPLDMTVTAVGGILLCTLSGTSPAPVAYMAE